jgi:predicted N-formylglutamate amidohydrolase
LVFIDPAAFDQIIITCEHGGNEVPAEYAPLFQGQEELLHSHRGWDPGALDLARAMAASLGAPLFAATITRLLVDLNRSRTHRSLFSELTASLPESERAEILCKYYDPYRNEVQAAVERHIAAGKAVLQLSAHSFVPEHTGKVRNADLGLLYDPSRETETWFCKSLQQALKVLAPHLKVRRNYPYLGIADGFITCLRRHLPKHFPAQRFAGVEIEVSQRYPLQGGDAWQELQRIVIVTLQQTLSAGSPWRA